MAAKRMMNDADSIAYQALAAARSEEDRKFDLLVQAQRAFELARDRRLALEDTAAKPVSNDPTAGMINMAAAKEITGRSDDCLRKWAVKHGCGRKIGWHYWFDQRALLRVKRRHDK
jgi:uncharacterized protein YecT (DUF1311 family)